MQTVRISRRLILREMVHQLGLHLSGYDTDEISRGRFVTSVSVQGVSAVAGEQPMVETCRGLPERSIERAEESCASAVIARIKRNLRVDVDDINYMQKILLDSNNDRYETEYKKNQEIIQHLGNCLAEFRGGWDCTIKQIEWIMDIWDPSRRNSDAEHGPSTGSAAGTETGDIIPTTNGLSPYEDITKKLSMLHTDAVNALEAAKGRMVGISTQLP